MHVYMPLGACWGSLKPGYAFTMFCQFNDSFNLDGICLVIFFNGMELCLCAFMRDAIKHYLES